MLTNTARRHVCTPTEAVSAQDLERGCRVRGFGVRFYGCAECVREYEECVRECVRV